MRFALILVFVSAFATNADAMCADNQVSLRGPWGEAVFNVEIAADDKSRSKGLMFRKSLPVFSGMLFIYDQPQHARFWMKNTLIPLDMLFLDTKGVVRNIHRMAEPGSLDIIDGGRGILEVLEIDGGVSDQLGIDVGSQLRHPSFGDGAAWGCE